MPVSALQKTTNSYLDFELGGSQVFTTIQFSVSAPYSAYAQVATLGATGKPEWIAGEVVLQPGQGGYTDIYGIRFRSYDPANPTAVLCTAYFADDPTPSGFVSSTGVFTGGTVGGSQLITGYVKSDGTILGGSGYAVLYTGPGAYTITFTAPLSGTPCIVGSATGPGSNSIIFDVHSNPTATGFDVRTYGAGQGTDVDSDFQFIATLLA